MNAPRTVRDPGARLASAIVAHGDAAGCAPMLVAVEQHDWASATFVGWHQRIVLSAAPGAARTAWLAALPEAEFTIPRHCLADLAIVNTAADGQRVTIETLLLCDG